MKPAIYYWMIVTLLAAIHLNILTAHLGWMVPIYLIGLLIALTSYLLHKKWPLPISSVGLKWNGLLFCLQLLILYLSVSFYHTPSLLAVILLFIGIELVRIHLALSLSAVNKERENFEEQREQFNETFRLVRSERHDFLKHVSSIHFLLENNQYEEAKVYLDELVDGYKETNLLIRGEHGIVAGLLHQMYRKARAKDIEMSYDLDVPLSTLPLTDNHIVTLIGNLLSNSIEACEEWQQKHHEKPLISLQFYKRSGLFLLICKNNSLPVPAQILDNLFHTYGKTTKTNDHEGLGTKIIDDIVKDYDGFLDFVYKDAEFTVKIKIPAVN